jgi:hypothetical protein
MRCSDPGNCVCGFLCAGVQPQRSVLLCHRPGTAGEFASRVRPGRGARKLGSARTKMPGHRAQDSVHVRSLKKLALDIDAAGWRLHSCF